MRIDARKAILFFWPYMKLHLGVYLETVCGEHLQSCSLREGRRRYGLADPYEGKLLLQLPCVGVCVCVCERERER
jgi:hypothetical protein